MALLVRTPSRTFWNWSGGCPHPCLSQVPNMANPEIPGPFSLVVAFQAHSMSVAFLEKYTSGSAHSPVSYSVLTIYNDCFPYIPS